MIYLYAHTNHKSGLDSLRRVAALYWQFEKEGVECELLFNDYRAQLAAKSWGLPLATTIETIKDIDAVADINDVIVIDSPEPIEGKVLGYPEYFKKVIYLDSSFGKQEFNGAKVIDIFHKNSSVFREVEQNVSKKALFIYGDSDYEKTILKNLENFKDKELNLYWGNYFFIKYEDEMMQHFGEMVETEDYYEALSEYEYIVTSSLQIAIEAAGNGVKTLFLDLLETSNSTKEILHKFDIPIKNTTQALELSTIAENEKIKNSSEKIINIIKNYV